MYKMVIDIWKWPLANLNIFVKTGDARCAWVSSIKFVVVLSSTSKMLIHSIYDKVLALLQ